MMKADDEDEDEEEEEDEEEISIAKLKSLNLGTLIQFKTLLLVY